MLRLLVKWLLHAVALLITANLVPGFLIRSFGAALLAVIVIGFLNATIGAVLKLLTLPIGILTLGLFFLVINAIMLEVAGSIVPGFRVVTFGAALIGALVLAILQMLFKLLMDKEK
ncbi:MAG TPA: phage holin family protein [Acidobacteriaceae bacterium]|nr:phage holin family protein [Acidobacteriaceae bacterium]